MPALYPPQRQRGEVRSSPFPVSIDPVSGELSIRMGSPSEGSIGITTRPVASGRPWFLD